MKIEINKWIRTDNGTITQVIDICHCSSCKERGFFEPILSNGDTITKDNVLYINDELVIATADKPQELVQVGDLVVCSIGQFENFENRPQYVFNHKKNRINSFTERNVIAIYTLNSNGDYIKQWEEKI